MNKNYFIALLLLTAGIANAQGAPLAQVQINTPIPVCNPGQCTALFAEYDLGKTTDDYTVASILYTPSFPFTGGIYLDANNDDVWTPVVNLPFNFCFYGTTYNQILVGSNGVITFDLINQSPVIACPWSFSQTIPNTGFPIKNAIYGVYQDTDIRTPPVTNAVLQNVNYYVLNSGVNEAPNRVFVANFNELPTFQCGVNAGLQTSQIVLYEGTNIIEVFIQKRSSCATWNSGRGVVGIQNQAGNMAVAPAGRNTGTWSTTNEAWRFTPNGSDVAGQLTWFADGVQLTDTSNPLQICPTEDRTYVAQVTFANCGNTVTISDTYDDPIIIAPLAVNDPFNINLCVESVPPYVVNLTDNSIAVLGGVANPENYELQYYTNLQDAEDGTSNYIQNLSNYNFADDQIIYIRVEDIVETGCFNIKSFNLTATPPIDPPTGNGQQDFTQGQTLGDLEVTGQNITWYDAPTQGNILPMNTIIQDNVTYYASQTLNGCESRNVTAARLAVTANLVVLSKVEFGKGQFAVYPNPVQSILTVAALENLKSIEINNTIGQQIMVQYPNAKEAKLDLTAMPDGIYFVKITSENRIQTVKVLK